jgi:hypothetical protein
LDRQKKPRQLRELFELGLGAQEPEQHHHLQQHLFALLLVFVAKIPKKPKNLKRRKQERNPHTAKQPGGGTRGRQAGGRAAAGL